MVILWLFPVWGFCFGIILLATCYHLNALIRRHIQLPASKALQVLGHYEITLSLQNLRERIIQYTLSAML